MLKQLTKIFLSLEEQNHDNRTLVQIANDISFSSVFVELPTIPLNTNAIEKLKSCR